MLYAPPSVPRDVATHPALCCQDLLRDLNIGSNKHRIMEMAVSLALDRHDPQRELTSRLISDLYGQLLTRDEMMEGFHVLLTNLPDLSLDTPDAPSVSSRPLVYARIIHPMSP